MKESVCGVCVCVCVCVCEKKNACQKKNTIQANLIKETKKK